MSLIKVLKKNVKFYLILLGIVLIGTIGVTFSLVASKFKAININTLTVPIDASITYNESSNGSTVTNNGNMLPISDSLVTGPNVTDSRVLKVTFNVTGVDTNPENSIYDIVLRNVEMDCDLASTDLKWRLYKEDSLISEGNLSPTFDAMAGGRLVLTNTQEDLTTSTNNYTFLLWISENCTGDITECDASMNQNKYLNKNFSGVIKIELATGSKKNNVRVTGSENSCNYIEVEVPICNNLTYNAASQVLFNSGDNYTLINNTGTTAGKYAVTVGLEDGYKWSDGSTSSKVLYCSIKKKDVTITTLDQSTAYSESVSSTPSDVSISNLLSGHRLDSITITSSSVKVGTSYLTASNAKIVDASNNDVTSNYNITYNNTGVLTVNMMDSKLTLSKSTLDLVYPNNDSLTYTYIGDSIVTCSSSSPSIATCKVDTTNKMVTVIPETSGSATITVGASEGTNYNATYKTLSVTVSYKTYEVTLNNQDATSTGTTTIYGRFSNGIYLDSSYTKNMTTSSNAITVPMKTGYTFGGYYTSTNGDGTQLINTSGNITSSFTNTLYSADVTLYAKWTPKTYTISYDANGGTGAPSAQTKTYGQSLTLSSTVPTRTDYEFLGWSTNKDATSATYAAGSTFTVNANTTLYAVWKQSIATIAKYITNLYTEAEKTTVTNNSITYNYANIYDTDDDSATSGGLMNDRLGGTTSDYNAGNIRYYGASPNNYIYFNCSDYTNQSDTTCEKWRIIGVFDGKVKIIRNESIGDYSWDNKNTSTGAEENYGKNDWATARLMKLLNPSDYYEVDTNDNGLGQSLYYTAQSGTCYSGENNATKSCNFTTTGLKNDTTRNMIEEVTWNLGGYSNNSVYSDQMYEYERGEEVYSGRSTSWTGKIALPYTSDYGYATDFNSCTQTLNYYNNSACTSVNWMKTMFGGNNMWLLTPHSSNATSAWGVNSSGFVGYGYSSNANGVRPVLYLDSELAIESGDGSTSNPYRLSVS